MAYCPEKTKKIVSVITVLVAALGCLTAYAAESGFSFSTTRNEEFAEFLREVKTNQYFTDDPVPEEDIELILQAGINAESGMNQQNWHFSAVTNKEVQQEIADDMGLTDSDPYSKAMIAYAPLAIIVSYGEEKQDYYRELLGIPEEKIAVGVLLVGYLEDVSAFDNPVAVTGATTRNDYSEMATIVR